MKKYLLFFISKPNSDKVRPISLASCVCKICERMVSNRLVSWLEYYNKLPKSQFGFRCSRSSLDNVAILHTDILKVFKKVKSTLIAIFLDIKGAYNYVLPDILIEKLKKLGVSRKMLAFIYNLISSRQLYIRYGDECIWTFHGVIQGGVLSPILYDIYTGDLEEIIDQNVNLLQ